MFCIIGIQYIFKYLSLCQPFIFQEPPFLNVIQQSWNVTCNVYVNNFKQQNNKCQGFVIWHQDFFKILSKISELMTRGILCHNGTFFNFPCFLVYENCAIVYNHKCKYHGKPLIKPELPYMSIFPPSAYFSINKRGRIPNAGTMYLPLLIRKDKYLTIINYLINLIVII